MTRINITIDNELKNDVEEQAKKLGLSLSAYIRLILVNHVKNSEMRGIDKGLLDLKQGKFEVFDKDDYMSKLNEMIKHAKS